MSFLSVSAVEDDSATLRELLAAVDAWDPRSPTSLACAVDKIAAPFIEDEPTTAVHRTHATSIGKPAKKRTRNPEEDVRRRLRRKAERESLRQHVRDLQVKLARLLEVRRTGLAPTGEPMVIPPATTLIGHSSVRTHSDAAMSDDQRELADARTINQELKARIAQNEVLMRALNDSITGTFLFTCRLTMASGVDVSPLRQMYANVKRIKTKIPPFGPESMLCTSNISVGLDGSPRVEVMAGVHLNRDVRGAAGVIAAYFKELCPFGRSVQHCIETNGNVVEQGYSMDVPFGEAASIVSTGVVQKYERSDSMVLVWTSNIFHPTGQLTFLGRAWVIITPSPHSTAKAPMTLVQSYYNLSSVESGLGGGAGSVRAILVGAMGDRVQFKHRLFLRTILSATGRSDLAAAIVA